MRLALWVASPSIFGSGVFGRRKVQAITDKKCLYVIFLARMIHSASPYLLLRAVQFYLANPKQVKSKAQNYFQVWWPGHPCLQVVELWFDEFSPTTAGWAVLKHGVGASGGDIHHPLQSRVGATSRISLVEIMKPDLSSRPAVCRQVFKSLLSCWNSQRCFVWQKKEPRKKNETPRPR